MSDMNSSYRETRNFANRMKGVSPKLDVDCQDADENVNYAWNTLTGYRLPTMEQLSPSHGSASPMNDLPPLTLDCTMSPLASSPSSSLPSVSPHPHLDAPLSALAETLQRWMSRESPTMQTSDTDRDESGPGGVQVPERPSPLASPLVGMFERQPVPIPYLLPMAGVLVTEFQVGEKRYAAVAPRGLNEANSDASGAPPQRARYTRPSAVLEMGEKTFYTVSSTKCMNCWGLIYCHSIEESRLKVVQLFQEGGDYYFNYSSGSFIEGHLPFPPGSTKLEEPPVSYVFQDEFMPFLEEISLDRKSSLNSLSPSASCSSRSSFSSSSSGQTSNRSQTTKKGFPNGIRVVVNGWERRVQFSGLTLASLRKALREQLGVSGEFFLSQTQLGGGLGWYKRPLSHLKELDPSLPVEVTSL